MSLNLHPSLPLFTIKLILQHLQSYRLWVTLSNLLQLLTLDHRHHLLPLNRFLTASQILLYSLATTVDMDRHAMELLELDLDQTFPNLLSLLRTHPSSRTVVDPLTVLHLIKRRLTSLNSSSSSNILLTPLLPISLTTLLLLTPNLNLNLIPTELNRVILPTRTTILLRRIDRTQEVETARQQCLHR